MSGPESKLYKTLRQVNPDMFMKRIENTLSNGTPDIYFQAPGYGGWCELKISSGKRDRVILPKYTIQQRRWHKEHMESGGISLLCIKHRSMVIWYRGESVLIPEDSPHFYEGTTWPNVNEFHA